MVIGLYILKQHVNLPFYKMNQLDDTVIQRKTLKCLESKEKYDSKSLSSFLPHWLA